MQGERVSHVIREAGGVFGRLHRELMGLEIDWSLLNPAEHEPAHIELAQRVWSDRVRTEFRSVQIMTRFLSEVVGAGDPLDIYAGAAELIGDEIRHTALCVGVWRALGVEPRFPDPVAHIMPPEFMNASMGERALNTAITMLLVSETLSVGFITDLQERCEHPVIRAVLDATVEDEADHEAYGREYVRASLKRFPASTRPQWRKLVGEVVSRYRTQADQVLAGMSDAERTLDAWPERELVALGLHSPQRQALVLERTWRETLAPTLVGLELL
jgi:hypothetical protein